MAMTHEHTVHEHNRPHADPMNPHSDHGETMSQGTNSGHAAHGDHSHHDPAQFRDRFWITLALTLPVMFFSEMFQELLGYTAPSFPGSTWISPVLGTVIFVYGGWAAPPARPGGALSRQPRRMTWI